MIVAATIKLLTCIESIVIAVITIRQGFGDLKTRLFAAYLFLIAAQAFVELHLVVADSPVLFFTWKRADVLTHMAVGVMFHFSLAYSGSKLARQLVFVIPFYLFYAAITAVSATASMPFSVRPTPFGFESVRSPAALSVYIATLSVSVVVAFGTLLVLWWKYRQTDDPRTKKQDRIMLTAMGVLVMSGVVIEVAHPIFHTPLPFALSGTTAFSLVNPFLGYALLRYNLLKISPAAAADEILHMMTDGVLLLDPKGRIRYANSAAEKLLQIPAESLITMRTEDLPIRRVDRDGMIQEGVFGVRESVADEEGIIVLPTQAYLPVSMATSPLLRRARITGFIITIRDISTRKQAEERRRAVEKIMRHDIKNSLGAIIGFSEMLSMETDLSAEHRQWVETIYKSGEMTIRQIESYLAIERMENGTFALQPELLDPLAVLKDAVFSLSRLAEDRKVLVRLTVDGRPIHETDRLMMVSEEPLLFSLVTNLMKNAIEASRAGQLVEASVASGERITLRFQNTGVIPDSLKTRFFEKFVTHGKQNGTGLGTYGAKLITQTLGGHISLETDPDALTVAVVVDLPANQVSIPTNA